MLYENARFEMKLMSNKALDIIANRLFNDGFTITKCKDYAECPQLSIANNYIKIVMLNQSSVLVRFYNKDEFDVIIDTDDFDAMIHNIYCTLLLSEESDIFFTMGKQYWPFLQTLVDKKM